MGSLWMEHCSRDGAHVADGARRGGATAPASFLFGYAHFLPCRLCSRHFTEFLRVRATERTLSSRKSVIRLLFDAHNDVNIRNGKRKLTMDEYDLMYSLQEKSPRVVANVATSLSVALCMYFVGRSYVSFGKKLLTSEAKSHRLTPTHTMPQSSNLGILRTGSHNLEIQTQALSEFRSAT